jgi:hypothetical protein
LWTRIEGFERPQLNRALTARRAVKATLMRGTVHLVSTSDYLCFLPAVLPMLREYWRPYLRHRTPVTNVDELAARALAFTSEPRSSSEMATHLGHEDRWWRVRMHAPFVRAPGDGSWAFGPRPAFVSGPAWVARPLAGDADGGLHLLRRYLRAFGPASVEDVAAWSGLRIAAVRELVPRLELRRFRDERGRLLLDLPRAPLPPPATPAPPRLLPAFDNLILSHADRTRVIADDHRRTVIRGGIVDPVFLVDGFVAGRWRVERARVELEPFGKLPREAERALRREADALARWLMP